VVRRSHAVLRAGTEVKMTPLGVKFRMLLRPIILGRSPTPPIRLREGPRRPVVSNAPNRLQARSWTPLLVALLAALPAAPTPALGQERTGPIIPSGLVRFDFPFLYEGWDQRYTIGGGQVSLGSDFSSATVGSGIFPGIASLEEALAIADPGNTFGIDMGSTRVSLYRERIELPIRLEAGVFDWLSIGGTLPLSKRRAEIFVDVDGEGANAGVSPTLTDPTAVSDFLGQYGAATSALASRAEDVCTASGPTSSACEDISLVRDAVSDFGDALESSYLGSAAFPLAETDAATALQAWLTELQQRAGTAGVTALPGTLPLSTQTLDDETFGAIVADEGGSIQADPLEDWQSSWEMGDVEVFANARLLGSSLLQREEGAGATFMFGVGALMRLGTGTPDSPDNFIDLGTGDGTTDLEGRAFFNLRASDRFGAWANVTYGVQGSTQLQRRVARSDQPLAPLASRQTVEVTPGSYLEAEFVPRLHLTDQVALTGSVRYLDKAVDEYAAVAGSGGYDVSVLEDGTAMKLTEIGAGASFSSLIGEEGRLMEARFRYVWSVSGSEGRFRKVNRLEFGMRLFRRFWGERVLR